MYCQCNYVFEMLADHAGLNGLKLYRNSSKLVESEDSCIHAFELSVEHIEPDHHDSNGYKVRITTVHNDTGQNEEPARSVVVLHMWEGNSIKRAIRECITSYCYLFHRFKRGMFRMQSTTVDRKDLRTLSECRLPLVIPKSSVLSDELQLLGSLHLCIMIEILWYSLFLNIYFNHGSCISWC